MKQDGQSNGDRTFLLFLSGLQVDKAWRQNSTSNKVCGLQLRCPRNQEPGTRPRRAVGRRRKYEGIKRRVRSGREEQRVWRERRGARGKGKEKEERRQRSYAYRRRLEHPFFI